MVKYTQTIEIPLDMDKVPCYIGDKVYDEKNGLHRIVGILQTSALVLYSYDTCDFHVAYAFTITHKPFETWEDLEKDLNLEPYLYCKKNKLITKKESGFMSTDLFRALKASDAIKRAQRIGDIK